MYFLSEDFGRPPPEGTAPVMAAATDSASLSQYGFVSPAGWRPRGLNLSALSELRPLRRYDAETLQAIAKDGPASVPTPKLREVQIDPDFISSFQDPASAANWGYTPTIAFELMANSLRELLSHCTAITRGRTLPEDLEAMQDLREVLAGLAIAGMAYAGPRRPILRLLLQCGAISSPQELAHSAVDPREWLPDRWVQHDRAPCPVPLPLQHVSLNFMSIVYPSAMYYALDSPGLDPEIARGIAESALRMLRADTAPLRLFNWQEPDVALGTRLFARASSVAPMASSWYELAELGMACGESAEDVRQYARTDAERIDVEWAVNALHCFTTGGRRMKYLSTSDPDRLIALAKNMAPPIASEQMDGVSPDDDQYETQALDAVETVAQKIKEKLEPRMRSLVLELEKCCLRPPVICHARLHIFYEICKEVAGRALTFQPTLFDLQATPNISAALDRIEQSGRACINRLQYDRMPLTLDLNYAAPDLFNPLLRSLTDNIPLLAHLSQQSRQAFYRAGPLNNQERQWRRDAMPTASFGVVEDILADPPGPLDSRPSPQWFNGTRAEAAKRLRSLGFTSVAAFVESDPPCDDFLIGGYPIACLLGKLSTPAKHAIQAPVVALEPGQFTLVLRQTLGAGQYETLRWTHRFEASGMDGAPAFPLAVRTSRWGSPLVLQCGILNLVPAEQVALHMPGPEDLEDPDPTVRQNRMPGDEVQVVWSHACRAAWTLGSQPLSLCPNPVSVLRWVLCHNMAIHADPFTKNGSVLVVPWLQLAHAPPSSHDSCAFTNGVAIGCCKAAHAYRRQREDPRWGSDAETFDPFDPANFCQGSFVPPWLLFLTDGLSLSAPATQKSELALRRLELLLLRDCPARNPWDPEGLGWLGSSCFVDTWGVGDIVDIGARTVMLWSTQPKTDLTAVPMCPLRVCDRLRKTDDDSNSPQQDWQAAMGLCRTTVQVSWSSLPFQDDGDTDKPDEANYPWGNVGGQWHGKWHVGQVPISLLLNQPDGAGGQWFVTCLHPADLVATAFRDRGSNLHFQGSTLCEYGVRSNARWNPSSSKNADPDPKNPRLLLQATFNSTDRSITEALPVRLCDPHTTQTIAVALEAWSSFDEAHMQGGPVGVLLSGFVLRKDPVRAVIGRCSRYAGVSMLHGQYAVNVYRLDRPSHREATEVLEQHRKAREAEMEGSHT